MKKSEWNDEQLEQMLNQMPALKDNRNPQEIYQNISSKIVKRQKKTWLVPSLATAAALLLIFLISPGIINEFGTSNQESSSTDSGAEMELSMKAEDKAAENSIQGVTEESVEDEESVSIARIDEAAIENYVIFENQLENKSLLTYNVPHITGQFMVPVSVLVETEGQNPVQLMSENISSVNGEISQSNWEVETFPTHFYDLSEITNEDGTKHIRADIKSDINPAAFSSGESDVFFAGLQSFRWFSQDYQQVDIFLNGEQNFDIGNIGRKTTYDLEQPVTYHMYVSPGSAEAVKKFIVPTPERLRDASELETFKTALSSMTKEIVVGEFSLQPTITEGVEIEEINDAGENVTIVFSSNSKLDNNDDNILMIEAIMLTAKEYGFKTVTFQGGTTQIGNVMFGEAVQVPLAPNPISIQ